MQKQQKNTRTVLNITAYIPLLSTDDTYHTTALDNLVNIKIQFRV